MVTLWIVYIFAIICVGKYSSLFQLLQNICLIWFQNYMGKPLEHMITWCMIAGRENYNGYLIIFLQFEYQNIKLSADKKIHNLHCAIHSWNCFSLLILKRLIFAFIIIWDLPQMQVLLLSFPGVHGESPEYKLITSLLSKYDINARPVMDPTKPIRVDMEVNLMQIIDLVRSMQISCYFHNFAI